MITVIGHGRSASGKGWGGRIDAASLVMRMWNCGWQSPEDYGTRYDWGLIETHKRLLAEWRKGTEPVPSGWVCSILDKWSKHRAELPSNTVFINQQAWLGQPWAQALNGAGQTGKWQLSRGGIAAAWAIDTAEPRQQVVLVGFDNVRAARFLPIDEAFSEEYRAAPLGCWIYPTYAGEGTKDGNHDVVAERALLHVMAQRRGVELAFAQDIWP